ncbi:MAG: N-acetylmuramoyl-L-alanine amidase [Solirubrobacteraceae bacterium]
MRKRLPVTAAALVVAGALAVLALDLGESGGSRSRASAAADVSTAPVSAPPPRARRPVASEPVAGVPASQQGRPGAEPAQAPSAYLAGLVPPPRPRIVQKRIPFGPLRRAQMRAYAIRHYGIRTWRLRRPRVIVEHFTAVSTFGSTYNTFAADVPDVELHELPGVCSHYVIDRDGTIYQLVSTQVMCRHTVGLNWTAIGIEHVGTSDAQVMGDRRQIRASLRLTRWLRCRYGIAARDVIGHAESLSSPFHHERVASLRTQTHGDMARPAMNRYRRAIRRLGCSKRERRR